MTSAEAIELLRAVAKALKGAGSALVCDHAELSPVLKHHLGTAWLEHDTVQVDDLVPLIEKAAGALTGGVS